MIANRINYWRSTINNGKGISRAHLARRLDVTRSFVSKLEKGTKQPGSELMLRVALYFGQPVEAIFQFVGKQKTHDSFCANAIPDWYRSKFASAAAKPVRNEQAPPPERPAGLEIRTDKSLVGPTAKVVASLSRSKPNGKT
jgi:DNA-binding XRE family transcriptional regulator